LSHPLCPYDIHRAASDETRTTGGGQEGAGVEKEKNELLLLQQLQLFLLQFFHTVKKLGRRVNTRGLSRPERCYSASSGAQARAPKFRAEKHHFTPPFFIVLLQKDS